MIVLKYFSWNLFQTLYIIRNNELENFLLKGQ